MVLVSCFAFLRLCRFLLLFREKVKRGLDVLAKKATKLMTMEVCMDSRTTQRYVPVFL